MNRLIAFAGCVLMLAGTGTLDGQQLAQPAKAGEGALASAPQPRVSTVNQQLVRGTRGNVLTTIQGNALSAANGALPNAIVRLRDARYGRILDSQVTDKTGLFSFRAIDPGIYVVELMGADQTVLAASQLLTANAGDTVSAIVKMPWRVPPAGGLLGHTTASAIAVTSAAAASGLLATAVTNPPVSGEK